MGARGWDIDFDEDITHPKGAVPDIERTLQLGETCKELRVVSSTKKCCACGKDITPQLCWAHFETFKTKAFTSCGVRHPSYISWRVSHWTHMNCV